MNRETICDELRRLEGEVVEAEQALAEQEALLVKSKREGQDVSRLADALRQNNLGGHVHLVGALLQCSRDTVPQPAGSKPEKVAASVCPAGAVPRLDIAGMSEL
jgi:hypothetical protein